MISEFTLKRAAEHVRRNEGTVPHMYLDTAGLLTFGCGFRPPLSKYMWKPSLQHAEADAKDVLSVLDKGVHTAAWYKPYCRAYLEPEEIARVLLIKLREYEQQLNLVGWALDKRPATIQVVILDMAYNLGVVGLSKFKKFRAAIETADWVEAAAQCKRGGISDQRNIETAQMILGCVSAV